MSTRERASFPTADEIAARAHELFASGGRRVSLIPEYWRAAERELSARIGARQPLRYEVSARTASPAASKASAIALFTASPTRTPSRNATAPTSTRPADHG